MTRHTKELKAVSSSDEIAKFLQRSESLPVGRLNAQGRLLIALDATASREPTWDIACNLQCRMFSTVKPFGSLAIQLCYYRGFQQFISTPWLSDSKRLTAHMETVRCLAGQTQIYRVLQHGLNETIIQRVQALVFIGDSVEEPVDSLYRLAGQLRLQGTPVFAFHEGDDQKAATVFKEIARISGGVYAPFDIASADVLESLMNAAAAYTVGGVDAFQHLPSSQRQHIRLLEQQLRD